MGHRLFKLTTLVGLFLLLAPSLAFSQSFVEPGTMLLTSLNTPLSSRSNLAGDEWTATVISPDAYAGDLIHGHIAYIQPSGRFSGRTEMGLAFDSIELQDGATRPFNAELVDVRQSQSVQVVDENGNIVSGSRGGEAIKRGSIGAAAGALLGALIGGGRGAIVGLVAGGTAGAGSLFFDSRKELRLSSGANFDIEAIALRGEPYSHRVGALFGRGLVTNVQQALSDQGYYSGPVNGWLDRDTRSALANYQRDNGLTVTSTPDQATVKSLGIDRDIE